VYLSTRQNSKKMMQRRPPQARPLSCNDDEESEQEDINNEESKQEDVSTDPKKKVQLGIMSFYAKKQKKHD
jgi:hypothetical protein